jgi:hypothetical protein
MQCRTEPFRACSFKVATLPLESTPVNLLGFKQPDDQVFMRQGPSKQQMPPSGAIIVDVERTAPFSQPALASARKMQPGVYFSTE